MGKVIWLEIKRKAFHIAAGTLIGLLVNFRILNQMYLVYTLLGLVVVFTIYMHFKMPVLHGMMLSMEREEVMKMFPGSGAIFFVLGVTLSAWLFPLPVAVASIMVLSWGDGLSTIVGPHGRIRYINYKKTWEGLLAGIAAGGLVAAFFVPFWHAFAGAAVAMLIEGLDIKLFKWKIDDNLIVPLIAGAVMVGMNVVL